MRTKTIAVAAAALIALAGCSASTGASEMPAETPDPSQSETPAETASIEEWGSLVAEQQASVSDAWETWEGDTCSPSIVAKDPLCEAHLVVLTNTAQTAYIELDGASDPESPTYLGAPPDEVDDLVSETVYAAKTAASLTEKVDCPGEVCTLTVMDATGAYEELMDELSAWEPYL